MHQFDEDDEEFHWELMNEAEAPSPAGGHLVEYRLFVAGADGGTTEGVFHLTDHTGRWKIEEMYLTAYNGQAAEQWMALSQVYPELVAAAREARPAESAEYAPPAISPDLLYDARDMDASDDWSTDESSYGDGGTPTAPASGDLTAESLAKHPVVWNTVGRFFTGGGARKLGLLVLAVCGGIAALFFGGQGRK
jgi:hypothetical protein